MPSRRGGRGQSFIDSWLDDENSSARSSKRGSGKPKKKSPKASLADRALANAVVTEVFPNQCRVRLDATGEELLCSYRRVQLLSSSQSAEGARERTPVALGDRVLAEKLNPQSGVVEAVAPRANFLARPAPGREQEIHVVAANVDLLVIVASVAKPDFSPGLVDRYLIASQAARISSLLCITKADLQQADRSWEEYGKLGYDWQLVCAKTGAGMEELRERISGKTVVFCGHSGVGKTSLFRALTGLQLGKIGDVNVQTGKGRHTTTSAVMYRDEASGSSWIDTPGVREFGLIGVTPETLARFFPEFNGLACEVAACRHLDESGCQARQLFRYMSYRRIYESLLEAGR